jgi:hypothetical protein
MHRAGLILLFVLGMALMFFFTVGMAWLISAGTDSDGTAQPIDRNKIRWYFWSILAAALTLAYYVVNLISALIFHEHPMQPMAVAQLAAGQFLGIVIFCPLGLRVLSKSKINAVGFLILVLLASLGLGPLLAHLLFSLLGIPYASDLPFSHS